MGAKKKNKLDGRFPGRGGAQGPGDGLGVAASE